MYQNLVVINDSPQKIAAGLGIGVFFGVLPGLGPVAALFCAVLVRVNKAAALLGGILTNTWLSIPVFALAAGVGAVATGRTYAEIGNSWQALLKDFHWSALFKASAIDILLPVLAGYVIVSLLLGFAVYLATAMILWIARRAKNDG